MIYTEDFEHTGLFYTSFLTDYEFSFVIEDALKEKEEKEEKELKERKTNLEIEIALKTLESNKLKEEVKILTEELNNL